MFLITFDIIDSKNKEALASIPNIDNYLNGLSLEYKEFILSNIVINDGDQIRILVKAEIIIQLCFNIFSYLNENKLKARVFITTGEIKKLENNLHKADGEIFYKNKQLEQLTKENLSFYKIKENSIRYLGGEQTSTLDVLFLSLSKLSLKKADNIIILYEIIFNKLTQAQIANKYLLTQASISKKLKASEYEVLKLLIQEINKQLHKEETYD